MIRELTINEMEEVSGGDGVAAAVAINQGSLVVASLVCPIAMKTKNPYAALTCGVAVVVNYASYSCVRGAA